MNLDRLRKIEALASRGVEGERESARAMLDALCKKHGVTLDQLASAEKRPVHFFVSSDEERRVLIQVVVSTVGTRQVANRITKRHLAFWLTPSQSVDVHEAWDHYRPLWRTAVDDLATAFCNQYRLFSPDHANSDSGNDDAARWKRVAAMMASMEGERWRRRLRLAGAALLILLGLKLP